MPKVTEQARHLTRTEPIRLQAISMARPMARAAIAEALYDRAAVAAPMAVFGETGARDVASAATTEPQASEAVPALQALYERFVVGTKPSGPIAPGFDRSVHGRAQPAESTPPLDSSLLVSRACEEPRPLRQIVSAVVDAHLRVLEKKAGLAAPAASLRSTIVPAHLTGAQRAVLEQAVRKLGPPLRFGAPNSGAALALGEAELDAMQALVGAFRGAFVTDADVEALIALVFMQLGAEADRDLRDELDAMHARMEQKKQMRNHEQAVRALQGEAKELLRAEFDALSRQGAIDCTFEAFAAERPLTVVLPVLTQSATGVWTVKPGSVALAGAPWTDASHVPPSLRTRPDPASDAGLAATYGLSTDAMAALREHWVASGSPGTFESFLTGTLKLEPAANKEDAEANKQAALTALGGGGERQKSRLSAAYAKYEAPAGIIEYVHGGPTPESTRSRAVAKLSGSSPAASFGVGPEIAHGQRLTAFDDAASTAKADLDTISDETQLEQMRLQQYLERRSKAYETLSNALKKLASTSQGLIENLK